MDGMIAIISHIVATLYMLKSKYNKAATIGIWAMYAILSFVIMKTQINLAVGFLTMLIGHFILFFVTTEGSLGEKLFLILTYSNSFCICLGAKLYISTYVKNISALSIISIIILILMHLFLYKVLIKKHKKAKGNFENGWSKLNVVLALYLVQFVTQYAFSVDADTVGTSVYNFIVFSFILYTTLMVFYMLVEGTAEKNKRVAENRKLKNIAYLDSLTKLKNRTAYKEFVKNSKNSRDEDDVFVVVVMDVDNFKHINDTRGHIEGDKVLREVASELKEYFRDKDCELFRIGGDEFVMVSKEMNAIDVEEHMCALNEKTAEKIDITLSFGCAIVDFDTPDSFDSAFEKADKMMYQNKKKKPEPKQ